MAKRRWSWVVWPVVILLVLLISPAGLMMFAMWMSSDSWDFAGQGWRYWAFVKDTRIDRLGLVDATDKPVEYSVSFEEGTFPGWKIASYASTASPAAIMTTYTKRCQEMQLKITEPSAANPDASEASLTCEIEPYIDAEFSAERKPGDAATSVTMRVWGDD
jgi:hypothetical protein